MLRRDYQEPFNFHTERQTRMNDFPSNTDKGRGALFKIPDEDRKSDKFPVYRGDMTLPDGSKWKLSGWVKRDKNDKPYLSLSAEPFEERRQQEQPRNAYAQATGRDDRQREQAKAPSWADDEPLPF